MRKNIIFSIVALLVAIIPLTFVKAAEIKTLYVNQDFNDIVVKGSTDESVMAVVLEVYNEDESEFIKKQVAYVDDDFTFKAIIDVPNGKYILKVADYDGGEYSEVGFNKEDPAPGAVATEEVKEDTAKTPETLDNIALYVGLSIISIIGLVIIRKVKLN